MMSGRFNRPRTPPGPPPSSSMRKSTSARGTQSSSKSLPSKSYDDRGYEKFDKSYKSSAYQSSSKDYLDDKFKSGKYADKVASSKYVSKSVYIDDNFKVANDSQYSSSQRYNDKDSYSAKYADKGRYGTDEKYPLASATTSATSLYGTKKYSDYGGAYSDKASRYPKLESGGSSYLGSSYDTYGTYDAYGPDRQRNSGYGGDRVPLGSISFGGDKYGGSATSRLGGGYAGDPKLPSGNLSYGSDKLGRGGLSSTYGGGMKPNRGRAAGYGGEAKPAATARSRLYGGGEDDRRVYRSSFSPTRTSRSDERGYGGTYDDYSYATSSARSSEKQYLDRYVIGDSVVYGPPGQYPRSLQPLPPQGQRPPSPPSPPLMLSRNYNRYAANTGARRRRSLTPTTASAYRSLSPSSGRRPPSPPPSSSSRRPPSPDSVYMRGRRDRSLESSRPKERYNSKASTSRSPLRDNRTVADRRDDSRMRTDDRGRRETDRSLGSRDKTATNNLDSNKRGRLGGVRGGSGSTRNYAKDNYSSSGPQSHRDDRNPHTSPARNVRRDSRTDSGSRDRSSNRRIEDRLSINPPSSSRRSPVPRPRMGRNAASPRDGSSSHKRPRRPDDLRLWIESRKNEGGKKGTSQGHARPAGKGAGGAPRTGDRSKMKRARMGDPKRRLGVKARRTGGAPLRRNKILSKYRRITAKRGMRMGAGGRYNNRPNRDGAGGNRRGGDGRDGGNGGDVENSKPGSTASIRRVIEKPRKVSQVNNLEIRPRVMGKPLKKLLKDPKEENTDGNRSRSYQDHRPSHSSRSEGGSQEEKRPPSKEKAAADRSPSEMKIQF